jgi:L-alanine-DL-glutamate epimerase-like enolase superfamily enzyme
MVEFHSLWQLLPAHAHRPGAPPFGTYWHEDPIRMDASRTCAATPRPPRRPICASETLGSRWAFRDLLETGGGGASSCWT